MREAGVLCVGGIKKFEKSHGKVWLFGLSVVLLHSLSGTKRRHAVPLLYVTGICVVPTVVPLYMEQNIS